MTPTADEVSRWTVAFKNILRGKKMFGWTATEVAESQSTILKELLLRM